MRRWAFLLTGAVLLSLLPAGSAALQTSAVKPVNESQESAQWGAPNVKLVGRNSLFNRGMNAAIAIDRNWAYVGSRTDGTHTDAGVLVLDISNPRNPVVVNRIDRPEQARRGQTSRELRIWPEKDLLLVLNFACSSFIHDCAEEDVTPTIQFYDIRGSKAADPDLIHTYRPAREPHEFYLWDDPDQPGRALLYMSTPDGPDNVLVADISRARQGQVRETFSGIRIPGEALHSLAVNPAGTRAYLAYLEKGFLVADTKEFARDAPDPQLRLITRPRDSADWSGPGAHSAVKMFGTPHALVTDEVYGTFGGLLTGHGCPWGWTRVIDIRDPRQPSVSAQHRVFPYNFRRYCDRVSYLRQNYSSFAAHNPTLTRNLAFITWHSAGLQVLDIADPQSPEQAGEFKPRPLPFVFTEDPALSSGVDKVVMWSYPIIKDGLIYVVDVRNGLYVLRYTGDHAKEVRRIGFLEGNSNLGAAQRIASRR
jgi:hypothetical protein